MPGNSLSLMNDENPQNIVMEGYRDHQPEGIIKIGDLVYEAGVDFSYKEIFRIELNGPTGEGDMVVEAKYYFFNLPGKPTLTEMLQIHFTGFGISLSQHKGTGSLFGTKTLRQVEGVVVVKSHDELIDGQPLFFMHHFGLIHGWPF